MTEQEFKSFCQWSVEQQAKELMEERGLTWEEAVKETEEEIAQMLPNGPDTAHNDLMTIAEVSGGESVGAIWMLREETLGRKQSFLCDFVIWDTNRRKGYATAALALTEKKAAEAGCQESVLFVADRNAAAQALYEKCGYRVLRPSGYGKYMIKQLG